MALPQAPALVPENDELRIGLAAAADATAIKRLLVQCGLPTEDIGDLSGFIVARKDGGLCGVAGLQPLGSAGLLRSLAVAEASRDRGIARALCERIFALAKERRMARLYLLTTGAQAYFAKLAFQPVERSEAPRELRDTAQFRALCPESAVLMMRVIR